MVSVLVVVVGGGVEQTTASPSATLTMMSRILDRLGWGSYGILFLVGIALAIAAALYPRPRQVAKQSGVTEIVYWGPSAPSEATTAVIEEFERRHPQYHVVMGSAAARDMTADPTRFLLGVAGGVPPDLILFDRFAIVEWASRGAFEDLSPWIRRDANKPDNVRKENYYAPAWEEAVYKGRMYAVSDSFDTRAMYYNADPLIRAGLVYRNGDPEVVSGKAKPGEARPPKTWEDICRKRIHAVGNAYSDGAVRLSSFVRRSAVNEDRPRNAKPDLRSAGVRAGDVVVLVKGAEVFRGRVRDVSDATELHIDLERDQAPGLSSLPAKVNGRCEVKVFDQDGYVARLTRFDPQTGRMTSVGFIPMFGNSWLYMFGWLNGGEFMSADGSKCTLDSPEIIGALQWLVDVYDSMGGYEAANVFQTSAQSAALDPFLSGKIALRIDGDWLMHTAMVYKPNLNFGVCGSPVPERRLKQGAKPIGWCGGWAYAIPATAKNKDAAWELLQWLTSLECCQLYTDYDASVLRAKGQIYLPSLAPNTRVMAWAKQKYIDGNPAISHNYVQAYDAFVELLPTSKYRPVTPVGQKLWTEHVRAAEAAMNHTKPPYEALNYGTRQVQSAIDRILHPPTGHAINWKAIIAIYVAAIVVLIAAAVVVQRRGVRTPGRRREWVEGLICASPWLIGLLVFGSGPIFFSIIISFSHYDVLNPAQFVGAANYVDLMGRHYDPVARGMVSNDPLFWKSLANTAFMVIGVPIGIVAGLGLALLLDAKVRGMHVYRTIYYLPSIVPAVAGFILWIWIFEPSRGMLNQALAVFGLHNPPNWLRDPLWAKPSLMIMGLWGVGGSMIIWLAGLKDIPEALYEAARIDGASRWYSFWRITLPLLTPYILFQLIMGMIGVFQIFEAAFVMTDGGPADSTLFYAYKLFNEAFRYLNMGTASAMAWILFVVVLLITLLQLWISKRWVYYSGA